MSVKKLPVSTLELTFVATILGRSMTYDVVHGRFPSNGYHVAWRISISQPAEPAYALRHVARTCAECADCRADRCHGPLYRHTLTRLPHGQGQVRLTTAVGREILKTIVQIYDTRNIINNGHR